jgi:CBS domain-containing protein
VSKVTQTITARDIMTKDVLTFSIDSTLEEAADQLLRYRIHGAPVVDANGQLLGMVSFVDLVGRTGESVSDVMTPSPVAASPDSTATELATMMLDEMVHRVPVVDGWKVIGIVSVTDILRLFIQQQTP